MTCITRAVPATEGDPCAQLLQGPAWDAAKPHVLRTLSWSAEPTEALAPLEQALEPPIAKPPATGTQTRPCGSNLAFSDRGSCSPPWTVSQNRPRYAPYGNR